MLDNERFSVAVNCAEGMSSIGRTKLSFTSALDGHIMIFEKYFVLIVCF